jgi:hypothetical protein
MDLQINSSYFCQNVKHKVENTTEKKDQHIFMRSKYELDKKSAQWGGRIGLHVSS